MRMQLFWSGRSPFARKVTVAAHELGVIGAIELVPTLAMTTRLDPALAAVNPLGKLPTLVLADGTALYDSHVICRWLDLHHGGGLFPRDPDRLVAALRAEALGDGALELGLALRAEERREPAHRNARLIAAWHARVAAVVAAIEAERARAAADGFDIGAITVAVLLAYLDFRLPEFDWRAQAPATARWFADVAARGSMATTAFADD